MHDTPLAPLLGLTSDDGAVFGCDPLVFEDRLLGGGLIAAATLAAARSLDDPLAWHPAALDITFCRAGLVDRRLELAVETTHAGSTMALRRVMAHQGGRLVAAAAVRFHRADPIIDDALDGPLDDGVVDAWEPAAPVAPVAPEDCRPEHAVLATLPVLAACDVRAAPPDDRPEGRRLHPVWVRIPDVPPTSVDRAGLHEALVAMVTDLGTSTAAARPDTSFRERIRAVTLDHAVRWHRPARADDWFLVDVVPTVITDDRGCAGGTVRDRAGRLVASFTQEVRRPRAR